jgi:hypothetical protein
VRIQLALSEPARGSGIARSIKITGGNHLRLVNMFNVRIGCFETNSSSTHAVSDPNGKFLLDTIEPERDGIIRLTGGEFGWGWEKFNDALTKANYLSLFFTDTSELKDVIYKQTGCEVEINASGWIDHVDDHRKNIKIDDIRDFVFNKKRWLFLGNDNVPAPNKFYDLPGTKYRYQMSFQYEKEEYVWDFKKYPDQKDLSEALYKLANFPALVDGYEFKGRAVPVDMKRKTFSLVKGDCWAEAVSYFSKSDLEPWDVVGYKKVWLREDELQKASAIEISYQIQERKRSCKTV